MKYEQEEGSGLSQEQAMAPVMDALSKFRDMVRDGARAKDFAKVMAASDEIRNDILPFLGIRIEDKLGEVE